MSEQFNVPSET